MFFGNSRQTTDFATKRDTNLLRYAATFVSVVAHEGMAFVAHGRSLKNWRSRGLSFDELPGLLHDSLSSLSGLRLSAVSFEYVLSNFAKSTRSLE